MNFVVSKHIRILGDVKAITSCILIILIVFTQYEYCAAQQAVSLTAYYDTSIQSLFKVADSLRWDTKGELSDMEIDRIEDSLELNFKQKVYATLIRTDNTSRRNLDSHARKHLTTIAPLVDKMDSALFADYLFVKGNFHHNLEFAEYDSAFIYYKQLERLLERLPSDTLFQAHLSNRIGEVYQYGFNELTNAKQYLKKSLDYRKKVLDPMSFDLAISYYNQSVVERYSGELKLAEAYAKQAIKISQYQEKVMMELICFNLLANAYDNQGKPDQAIEWYQKLIEKAKSKNIDESWLKFAYKNLSATYLDDERYMDALELNNFLKRLLQENDFTESEEYVYMLYIDALCHHQLKIGKAGEKYSNALQAFKSFYPADHLKVMYMHYWYADFLKDLGEYAPAIEEMRKGLQIIEELWETKGDAAALEEITLSYELIGDIFSDVGELDSAYTYYQLADEYATIKKANALFSDSKLDFSKLYRPLYGKLIESISNSDMLTQDDKKILIFQAIEKNKYQILEERFMEKKRLKGSLDDSLSLVQYQLNRKIEEIESAYLSSGKDDQAYLLKIKELKNELVTLYQDAEGSTANKSSFGKFGIDQLMSILESDEIVIELFLTDSSCQLLLIDQLNSELKVFRVSKHYISTLDSLYSILSGTDLHKPMSVQVADYSRIAQRVYLPFKPIIDKFIGGRTVNKLIILPDGKFNYIPFEALLTEDVAKSRSFKDLPYLFYDFEITYALSGRMLAELRSTRTKKRHASLLAIGPGVNAGLENARREVEQVAQLFNNGTHRLSSQKEWLLGDLEAYDIIHLASHADIDEDNYQLNRLRFGSENEDSLMVFNYELDVLELHADLILLNACETSKGEEFNGEGVYSFTQSLIVSGARSVLSSQWQINDVTSEDISLKFYDELKKGKSIGLALRRAKESYLNEAHPEMSHPYYWAYLVGTGDCGNKLINKPITSDKLFLFISLGIVILSLGFIGILVSKANNLKANSN